MAEQTNGLPPVKWSDVYNLFNTIGVTDAIRRVAAYVEMYGSGTSAEAKAALRMRSDAARIDKAVRLAAMSPEELKLYNAKKAERAAKKAAKQTVSTKKHA